MLSSKMNLTEEPRCSCAVRSTNGECQEALDLEDAGECDSHFPEKRIWETFAIPLRILIFLLTAAILIGLSHKSKGLLPVDRNRTNFVFLPPRQCQKPTMRREWRELSVIQQQNYIAAVQCLRKTPSLLDMNQSVYDDFPYVHAKVGAYCKRSLLLDYRFDSD